MFLIVGLGNPGPEYAGTRHNLGFMVIDEIARRQQITNFKSKCQSAVSETLLANHKVILVQPQTFMNNSGLAVRSLAEWFKIKPEKVIVIYDDVDLEAGQLRLREKGNAGGHHGIESVIASLGTTEFARVRVGIGRENLTGDVAGYVLAKIPPAQREILAEAVSKAAEAVEAIVATGLAAAMNKWNGS
jgi:peptidyl-tRNA hydrolase, PTH1 family